MSKPEPRWDLDYEVGRQAEMWVSDIREALKSDSIEVKRDRRAAETGNVYVEYQCKKRGKWEPSGIATTTAKLWMFVLVESEFGFVITTDTLKKVARAAKRNPNNIRKEEDGSHPTYGVVIRVSQLFSEILRERLKNGPPRGGKPEGNRGRN